MRVWERGSGITMACGTGACASTAAAAYKGLVQMDEWIRVTLDGGDLFIKINKDWRVEMKGPAQFVYEGETL
ncbi:MAG: diaminopimelate epimerase, partial [Christensenellales bacterium]